MDDSEKIRSFALLLVFVSAACSIYFFLLPNGNISKTAKRLLSVFFLACVLFPLFSALESAVPPAAFSDPAGASVPTAMVGPAAEAYEAAVRSTAEEMIRDRTDVSFEIGISLHITEDLSIVMDRLTVIFEREFPERETVTAALKKEFGAAAETEVRHADGTDTETVGTAPEG